MKAKGGGTGPPAGGLLIAQENIDEVIRIIRASYDDAKENLMRRFDLDEVQAQAICDMRLIALQGLNREKLQNEYDELEKKIAWYQELLSNRDKLVGVMKEELTEIRDKYGDDRLTEIQDVVDEIDIEDLIEEESCVFTLTAAGYMKRMPWTPTGPAPGGQGNLRPEPPGGGLCGHPLHRLQPRQYPLLHQLRPGVPEEGVPDPRGQPYRQGTHLNNIFQFEPGEKVTAMLTAGTMTRTATSSWSPAAAP